VSRDTLCSQCGVKNRSGVGDIALMHQACAVEKMVRVAKIRITKYTSLNLIQWLRSNGPRSYSARSPTMERGGLHQCTLCMTHSGA
jgi:hypothetical protein